MNRVKSYFLNSSLKTAISTILILGIFLPVAISSYIILHYEYEKRIKEYDVHKERTIDVLVRSSEVALWNFMPELATPMLDQIMLDPNIEAIVINKSDGSVFEERAKTKDLENTQKITEQVYKEGELLGSVSIYFKNTSNEYTTILKQLAPYMSFFLLFFLLGLGLISYLLKVKVTSPLLKLSDESKKIANRELNEPFFWDRTDEIGELGLSLERSRVALLELFSYIEEQNRELKELNINLDGAVRERTKELEDAIEELKATQSQLIESEKLAALGQIVAGVAHEINSPLGAIKSSTEGVDESIKKTLIELPKILNNLSDDNRKLFYQLMENVGIVDLSFKEKRALKKRLLKELEDMGVEEDTRRVADMLANMGIQENIEVFKPLFFLEDSSKTLLAAYHIGDVIKSIKNINFAAERAAKVVFALKSFARFDASEEKALSSLKDGLETALTIYKNQIKHSVELVRNYEDIEPVMCWADELNQVWTNLIHNALQAMEYSGVLEVSLYKENNYAVVSIKDNGCGMDEDVMNKMYKPFYTTKRRGEGSGLGLDIVQKIVAKHEGKIEVESKKGEGSTFRVYIPIGGKEPPAEGSIASA
ncbi:MAG: ATP-binding protein [Campylobacterales bacterium]